MNIDAENVLSGLWCAVRDAAAATAGEKVYDGCLELHQLETYLAVVEPGQIAVGRPSNDPFYSHLDAIIEAIPTSNVSKAARSVELAIEQQIRTALSRNPGGRPFKHF